MKTAIALTIAAVGLSACDPNMSPSETASYFGGVEAATVRYAAGAPLYSYEYDQYAAQPEILRPYAGSHTQCTTDMFGNIYCETY